MRFEELDLNLLRVFDAVLKEGSITAAAPRIGLTQSATSNALQRLRAHCQDPLFVRTTRGMQPTAYGRAVAQPISAALRSVRDSLAHSAEFDPRRSNRLFTIVSTDYGELLLARRITPILLAEAPGLSISFVRADRDKYREVLETSGDIALGQLPPGHADFVQQHILTDTLVCMVRRDHPRIRGPLTVDQFLEEAHVTVGAPALTDSLVRRALGRKASKRRVVMQSASHLVVPAAIAGSDLLAVTPAGMAQIFAKQLRLRVLELPFAIPSITVRQFWHRRMHNDAGHKWLRSVIAKALRGDAT